jgi:hypothetical protein
MCRDFSMDRLLTQTVGEDLEFVHAGLRVDFVLRNSTIQTVAILLQDAGNVGLNETR